MKGGKTMRNEEEKRSVSDDGKSIMERFKENIKNPRAIFGIVALALMVVVSILTTIFN